MKFTTLPLQKAQGGLLAHSLQLPSGKIAKGTRLTKTDLSDLEAAGLREVTVALLEPGDLHEDNAAMMLAKALVPTPAAQNLRISGAGAGRVNLYATAPGITRVKAEQINAINQVDAMISVATVPDYHRVDAGGMIATIKIISYGVREDDLQRACARAAMAIQIRPPKFNTATLIETVVNGETPSDKGRRAMAGRLDRMGMTLTQRVLCAHNPEALADKIRAAEGEVLFVLTGSATSDSLDVAPSALRAAGGEVVRFGMPVDPGNLLFLGRLGRRPVIGLPGCARSPALNGADWVMERVICGEPVASADIAAMGVGGLLKEIPTRPRPRDPERS